MLLRATAILYTLITFHKLLRPPLYVDNTGLTLQSKDISHIKETVNDDLKRLDLWMQGNKLSLKCVENSVDSYSGHLGSVRCLAIIRRFIL